MHELTLIIGRAGRDPELRMSPMQLWISPPPCASLVRLVKPQRA